MASDSPRVFLSYSHDSETHSQRVLSLANRLRSEGLNALLDQYEAAPPEGWPLWMNRQIRDADYVLLIATETYRRRFDGEDEDLSTGRGVRWEGAILSDALYQAGARSASFIPVIFEEEDRVQVPSVLRSMTCYNVSTREGYEGLYRHLTDQPGVRMPDLGGLRELTPAPLDTLDGRRAELAVEPNYANPEVQELSIALDAAYLRRAELDSQGEDTEEIQQTILDLSRRIREGGRLRAGDFLGHGRYQLIERIGQGGFAMVWRAYDKEARIMVAIKVLHGQYAHDRTKRERFFRGARWMNQLRHPGIIGVLEPKCQDGGFYFFVMEYLHGGDFHQAVISGRLSRGQRLSIIRQIGEAVHFAHEQGMIHRDIKPANILLDLEGKPKITDFDLVRTADSTGGHEDRHARYRHLRRSGGHVSGQGCGRSGGRLRVGDDSGFCSFRK